MDNFFGKVGVGGQDWCQKCFRGDRDRVSLGSTDEMLGRVERGGSIFCRSWGRARCPDELEALLVVCSDYGLEFWKGNLEGAERVPLELMVEFQYHVIGNHRGQSIRRDQARDLFSGNYRELRGVIKCLGLSLKNTRSPRTRSAQFAYPP